MESTDSLTNSANNTGPSPPKRVRLDKYDANEKESRSMFLERWKEQERYIDHLESRLNQLQKSIESDERLKEKDAECKKLKSMLNYRFLTKTTQQQTLVSSLFNQNRLIKINIPETNSHLNFNHFQGTNARHYASTSIDTFKTNIFGSIS